MTVEQLLGPLAALAGAIVVIAFLSRILREFIEELKAERNVWRERSLASDIRTDRLADAFELALKAPTQPPRPPRPKS